MIFSRRENYHAEKVGIVSEGEISIERKPEKRWLFMLIAMLSETFILVSGFELGHEINYYV